MPDQVFTVPLYFDYGATFVWSVSGALIAARRGGDARYARLATISVGHRYHLRQRSGYIVRRQIVTKTRGTNLPIGEPRALALYEVTC